MIWSRIFVQGGEHVAIVFGPTHGPEVGEYRLYNLRTGTFISEVWGDEMKRLKPSNPMRRGGRNYCNNHVHNH